MKLIHKMCVNPSIIAVVEDDNVIFYTQEGKEKQMRKASY